MVIDIENLPENSSDLKKIVGELAKRYDGLEQQNNLLAEQIAMLQQALFGRKSEKIKYVSPDQMNLFGDEVEAELPKEVPDDNN
jgi:Transposase C of IS166 homeodomain